jgi:tRNA 2-thiouridine synthesizing protein C
MSKSVKNIGFVLRQAPYGNSLSHDALDAVFAAATFEQAIKIFLMGDGVFLLMENQFAEKIQQKSLEKKLSALALYDIETLYVCENSFDKRQLQKSKINYKIKLLNQKELQDSLHQQDLILSF